MKSNNKIDLMEAFREYAKKELEFIKESDPNKVYQRVMPNFTDKARASADFIYKKIILGGFIEKDTIYLNRLKVTKYGKEEDIDKVIDKITSLLTKGGMKVINQL